MLKNFIKLPKLPKLYRINFRIKFSRITMFFLLSLTQKIEGINSIVLGIPDFHYIFWDMDNCTLEQAKNTLRNVQKFYKLSTIYITSDCLNSFRAFCFSMVDYKSMLKIILDTQYVDKIFFDYIVENNKATLRISNKEDRKIKNDLISVLPSFYQPIPERFNMKTYDTNLGKNTLSILIGDKN